MSFDKPSTSPDDGTYPDVARAEADTPVEPDADAVTEQDDDGVLYEDQVEPEYGILGFTLRELIIVGSWLVGFLVSFFPIGPIGDTIWTSGIHWILMMGVPTVAVFLIVLRRLSPDGIRWVGSLGIDQFASVAASVAAVSWAQVLWQQIAGTIATGAILIGWVAVVGQLAMLVLVAATVFAPILPRLGDDFHGRLETLAHRNANPVRPVISRPRPERRPGATQEAQSDQPREAGRAGEDSPQAGEPRVDTALTMVIPDAPSALDGATTAGFGHQTADEREQEPTPTFTYPAAPAEASATEPGEPAGEQAPIDVPSAGQEAVESEARVSEVRKSEAPESEAPEREAFEPVQPEASEAQPAHSDDESDAQQRDDEVEVLYNTAAVEALQGIFAVDESTHPREPAAHNTAPDGIAGAEVGDASAEDDAEPLLRRTRAEQTGESGDSAPGDAFDQRSDAPDGEHLVPSHAEPFWILAPTERDVLDERGEPLFRVGPTAWALAIEDRGGAFVVRHEDGRIGYLHDISDVTKG